MQYKYTNIHKILWKKYSVFTYSFLYFCWKKSKLKDWFNLLSWHIPVCPGSGFVYLHTDPVPDPTFIIQIRIRITVCKYGEPIKFVYRSVEDDLSWRPFNQQNLGSWGISDWSDYEGRDWIITRLLLMCLPVVLLIRSIRSHLLYLSKI